MKKLMTSIAAAAMLSTASFAADMSINQNGLGDYLVVPAYFANSAGWTTNIKVTNTDTDDAVVAKIVFREGLNSTELLDFLLYLSPGDVWEGKLSYNGSSVKIYSTDDSTVFNGVVTSTNSPLDREFGVASKMSPTSGYVEIFGATKIAASALNKSWVTGSALDKLRIYNAYNGAKVDDTIGTIAETSTLWRDVDEVLYSVATIDSASSQLSTTVNAVAFTNFTDPDKADASRNAYVKATQNTILDSMTNRSVKDSAAGANDGVLSMIDNLLAKNTVYTNFSSNGTTVNDTTLFLTVPTKKYWYEAGIDLTTKGYTFVDTRTDSEKALNLTWPSLYKYYYTLSVRDQMENTIQVVKDEFSGPQAATTRYDLERELSQINISDNSDVKNFKDGVAYVNIVDYNQASTTMPVIPTAMTAVSVGGANITNAFVPASK